MNLSGRVVEANSVIDIDEVLVANIQSVLTIELNLLKIDSLAALSSKIASITKSSISQVTFLSQLFCLYFLKCFVFVLQL